jgi:DNA modification methylase
MAITKQLITHDYAIYNGDCIEVMKDMPDNKIDLSIYSPPFGGLYHYSSS